MAYDTIKAKIYDFFLYFLVALLTSNVAVSVHILRNHFRGGQGHDYLDYARGPELGKR